VIAVPAGVRVLVATKPVDFRRGADSLVALVREQLRHDPFSGTIFIFRSKRADRLKIVTWDGSGLVPLWKRLEHGAFRWPPISDGVMRLGLHPVFLCPSSARPDSSAAWLARDRRSTGHSTVRAFGGRSRLLCPLLTSPLRSRAARPAQSGLPDASEISRGKTDRLHHTPAGFTTRPLMAADFAIICSLVRPGRPRIRFLSSGRGLLHALSDPTTR
jgi:transposase